MIKSKKTIYTFILLFLLMITVVFSIKVTKRATNSVIEGDASAELVLANSLSKDHAILSKDWIYGNELRVLNTQLIFAPLFLVFKTWENVRFIGTLILQVIMLFSYAYMMHQAEKSLNSILLGCVLLLIPYCVVYGRITLYQSFYIPHITISFLFMGLLFSSVKKYKESKKFAFSLNLFVLFLFVFLSCLNGPRYITELLIPASLILLCHMFITNDYFLKKERKQMSVWYYGFLGSFISAFLGFIVNKTILSKYYVFSNLSERTLTFRTYFDNSIWKCILHQFGYRTNIQLLSILGIFSLLGVFVAIYCFSYSVNSIKAVCLDIPTILLRGMLPAGCVCIILEMYLINGMEITPRYFITSSVWMIPLLCSLFDENIRDRKITPGKSAYFLCIMVICINGFLNMLFFLNPNGIAKQPYEGLPITNPNLVGDLKHSIRFITEKNYEYGFAPFWEASTMTEKMNGFPVSGFTVEKNKIVPAALLKLRSYDSIQADKVFLLLDVTNAQYFPDFDVSFEWSEVYRDTHYVIYDIPNLDQLREYLSRQE